MKHALVAWTLFLVVVAIPATPVIVVGWIAGTAVERQIANLHREAERSGAAAVRREIEIGRLASEETLRNLSPDESLARVVEVVRAGQSPFHEGFVLDRQGRLVLPRDPAAQERLRPILDQAKVLTAVGPVDPRDEVMLAAIARAAGVAQVRTARPHHVALQGTDDGAVACRRVGDEMIAGYVATERSVIEGAAAHLAPYLTLVRKRAEDGPADVHAIADPKGNRLSVALRDGDGAADVPISGSRLAFRVAPRDPAALERAERRAGAPARYVTIGSALVLVLLAGVFFAQKRRAQQLANLRTDFVAAVSHELRTPLGTVRMLAELLEAEAVPPSERAEVERTLAGESRRLAATLERMLRFGALARGKLVATKERTPIAPLLDAAAARLRIAHPAQEVVVEAPADLAADVDTGLVALALDNLLGNAVKYAPDGGPYRVAARADGADVVLSVSDRGPGLDRRAQGKVFQPFERVDDRLSRATQGTGVGLALVRGIARAHGGEATITSAPGEGATFALRLPRG